MPGHPLAKAERKKLARAWTVGKPLKAYKPHHSGLGRGPQSRASAAFTSSSFDGR